METYNNHVVDITNRIGYNYTNRLVKKGVIYMKDKNNTRIKIIEAMYHLIATEGYEKASIGKVSDAIGITKAAAYYYFKSKDDILLEVVKKSYEADLSKYTEKINEADSEEEYINQLLQFRIQFIGMYESDPEFRKVCYEIDIQVYRVPKVKEMVDYYYHQFNDYLFNIIEKGVSLNLFEADTVTIKAQYLQTMLIGLDKVILFEMPISPQNVWRYVIDQLFLKEKK